MEKKNARNSLESSRTKKLLRDALMELLETESLSQITVSRLTRYCGLNRQTFYYHFSSIYGLVEWALEQDRDKFNAARPENATWQESLLFLLHHLDRDRKRYADISRVLGWRYIEHYYQIDLHALLEETLSAYVSSSGSAADGKYTQFLQFYFSTSLSAVLKSWLCSEAAYSPEELVANFDLLVHDQVRGATARNRQETLPEGPGRQN